MTQQLEFVGLINEVEETERAVRDAHRTKVFAWFDALNDEQKHTLAHMMLAREWDTCATLSTAAQDWLRSRPKSTRRNRRR